MPSDSFDPIDQRLLRELQQDCRQTVADLAAKAGLSPSACHRRIRLLEDRGMIERYAAILNGRALGYAMEFFVDVSLDAQTDEAMQAFEEAVRAVPEIADCTLMAGQNDYIMRIIARDTDDYERIHRDCLARLPGVVRIQSSLALRNVKRGTGFPATALPPKRA